MTQLTIRLSDRDYKRIEKAAEVLGKSVESLIQELVMRYQEPRTVLDDPLYEFEGFDADAETDLSQKVDQYLYGNLQ